MSLFPNYNQGNFLHSGWDSQFNDWYLKYNELTEPSGGGETCEAFKLVTSAPRFAKSIDLIDVDPWDFWVQIGSVNNIIPSNQFDKQSANFTGTTVVYLACTMGQQEIISVESATIETASQLPAVGEGYDGTNLRPTTVNIVLGYVYEVEGSYTFQTECGNILLSEYVIANRSTNGATVSRNITYRRIK